jgi:hypothetical protein
MVAKQTSPVRCHTGKQFQHRRHQRSRNPEPEMHETNKLNGQKYSNAYFTVRDKNIKMRQGASEASGPCLTFHHIAIKGTVS